MVVCFQDFVDDDCNKVKIHMPNTVKSQRFKFRKEMAQNLVQN